MDLPGLALSALCMGGLIYQWVATRELRRHLSGPRPIPVTRPPMTVLKPLCGSEPGLAENLTAVTGQAYPELQVVAGVAKSDDLALLCLPDKGIDVVVNPTVHGANLKVSNLINMLASARHEVLVISDSDVRPAQGWLEGIASALETPGVGLVTSLYVGRPDSGLWSRVGAMAINHGFLPSALVARRLGRMDGCFGASMAIRRELLERIGGLEPLADLLADDWALGHMVRKTGRTIALAPRPVDIMVHEPDLASLLAHEIRWARTIAVIDRWSYLGSIMTHPLALALLGAVGGAGPWPVAALLAGRLLALRVQERTLGQPRAPLHLLALRELLSLVVFVSAWFGRTVRWRGRRYKLRRDGSLEFAT